MSVQRNAADHDFRRWRADSSWAGRGGKGGGGVEVIRRVTIENRMVVVGG